MNFQGLRSRIKTWPIRRKLIANSLLTSSLALLLAGVVLIFFELRQTRLDVAGELASVAEMLGTNSTAALTFNDRHAAQQTFSALRAIHRISAAGIAKPDGSWFAAFIRPDMEGTVLPHSIGPDGFQIEHGDMILFRKIVVDGEFIGTVFLRSDMQEVITKIQRHGMLLVLVLLASSLASLPVASVLQRSIYGPVSQLASIAHEISAKKNYHARAVRMSDDELGILVDAFNGMLEQVEQRDRELEAKVATRTAELTRANHDLTDARDRAEQAARLKSEFLANMSHEIRTPMNVIIGMTQMTLETRLNDKQTRYLSMVRGSAESLLTIINDILDFSKIEAGKMEVESVEFRLPERLTESTMPLVLRAREKGLDLQLRMDPDLPKSVIGDPVRLGQVLMNLVVNAVKFTPAGTIEVSAKLEDQSSDHATVRFTVTDTGIGIGPDKLSVIFEPFRQADGSTTRRYGGTGLGLTISRHLVEMMGGRLWAESVEGQGSRFHFTVRFSRPVPVALPGSAALVERTRAIIIDPDQNRRSHLAGLLEAWSIEAAIVDGAGAALDVIRWSVRMNRPFSFAIVDAASALVRDRALLKELRQANPPIPLILMGTREVPCAQDAHDGGAGFEPDASFTWPASQSSLLEVLFRFLRPSFPGNGETPVHTGESSGDSSGLRILVAEDIPENQELLRAFFEARPDSLEFANNGREAVKAYQSGTFDLILMDIQMPDMSGTEATAAIRRLESSSGRHTPIIALTAHAMKGDRERYLASGLDGYVSKPIRPAELFQEIDRCVRNPAVIS